MRQYPATQTTQCSSMTINMTVTPMEGVACGYWVTYRLTPTTLLLGQGHANNNDGGTLASSSFAVAVPAGDGAQIGCLYNENVFGCVDADSSSLEDGVCVGGDQCDDGGGDDLQFRYFQLINNNNKTTSSSGDSWQCYDEATESYEVRVAVYGVEVVCGGHWWSCDNNNNNINGSNCSAAFSFVSASNMSQCELAESDPCPCPLASSSPSPLPNKDSGDGGGLSGGAVGGIAAGKTERERREERGERREERNRSLCNLSYIFQKKKKTHTHTTKTGTASLALLSLAALSGTAIFAGYFIKRALFT